MKKLPLKIQVSNLKLNNQQQQQQSEPVVNRNSGPFRIPKKKDAQLIKEITAEANSEIYKDIETKLVGSFLDKKKRTLENYQYRLSKLQLVNNLTLENNFLVKVKELDEIGVKGTSRFFFYLPEKEEEINEIINSGFECKSSELTERKLMGNGQYGIYLSKHLDVLLLKQLSEHKQTVNCILTKVHVTNRIQHVTLTTKSIESEPDFNKDIFVSKEAPAECQLPLDRYLNSMAFVVDLDQASYNLKQFPRNVVPHAVLQFEKIAFPTGQQAQNKAQRTMRPYPIDVCMAISTKQISQNLRKFSLNEQQQQIAPNQQQQPIKVITLSSFNNAQHPQQQQQQKQQQKLPIRPNLGARMPVEQQKQPAAAAAVIQQPSVNDPRRQARRYFNNNNASNNQPQQAEVAVRPSEQPQVETKSENIDFEDDSSTINVIISLPESLRQPAVASYQQQQSKLSKILSPLKKSANAATAATSSRSPTIKQEANETAALAAIDEEGDEDDEDEEKDDNNDDDIERPENIDTYDLYVKYYGDIFEEKEENTPRWRIHYELTGDMDVKFLPAKELVVKMIKLDQLKLKFQPNDSQVLNLNDATNKMKIKYYENKQQLQLQQQRGSNAAVAVKKIIPVSSVPCVRVFSEEQLKRNRELNELRLSDARHLNVLLEKINKKISSLNIKSE